MRLTVDGKTLTTPLDVELDPRLKVPPADLEKQFTLLMDIRGELTRVYNLSNSVIDLRKQIADMKRRVDPEQAKPMLREAQALDERLAALQKTLINTDVHANEDSLKFGLGIDGSLADLAIIAGGDADSAPTEASLRQFSKLKAEVDGISNRWSLIVSQDVPKVPNLIVVGRP